MMIEISNNWTAEDRLKALSYIASSYEQRTNMIGEEFVDFINRLYYLANSDALFLEKNKDVILNGHK